MAEARQKLKEIVSRFGREICDDPKRCRAALCDLCPESRREINVLVDALQENIVADLLSTSSAIPSKVVIDRLTQRLHEHRGISEDIAQWAVESWGTALGIITEGNTKSSPFQRKSSSVIHTVPYTTPKITSPSTSPSRHSVASAAPSTSISTTSSPGIKSIKDFFTQENVELSVFALGVVLSLIVDVQGKLPSLVFYTGLFVTPILGFSLSKRFQRKWWIKLLLYYLAFHGGTLISYMLGFRFIAHTFLYANFWVGIFLSIINIAYKVIG